jgi:predicted GIY-YIG superfamily endonuclease
MFVYLLLCSDNTTYIGATVNLQRRLRQHNKIITGGAKATGRKVEKGEYWNRVCYVSNFPDWKSTLQFEWRWKQISRKLSIHILPLERRIIALIHLLSLERSTSSAVAFQEWSNKPEIHIESEFDTCFIYIDNECDDYNCISE